MNKLILAVYLFSLVGLVTSRCDCCDQWQNQQNQQNQQIQKQNQNKNQNNNKQTSTGLAHPSISSIEGLKGSAFASRYWDCCKPSRAWSSNAGNLYEAKQYDVRMNLISDNNDARKYRLCSVYYFLKSNYIFLYGCNEVCYAFGAVPGAGLNVCERSFLVEYIGQCKYEKKFKC